MIAEFIFATALFADIVKEDRVNFNIQNDFSANFIVEEMNPDYVGLKFSEGVVNVRKGGQFTVYLDSTTKRDDYVQRKFDEAGDGCPELDVDELLSYGLTRIDSEQAKGEMGRVFFTFNLKEKGFLIKYITLTNE